MTDRPTTHPTAPSGHIAPEALSAILDGESLGAQAAWIERHLASCESCRHQRDQLIEVHSAVACLDTPAPADRAGAAVAVALDAFRQAAPVPARVAPARILKGAPAARLHVRERRLRVLGIAATLLLVAGTVSGLILGVGHGNGTSSSAASSAHSNFAGAGERSSGASSEHKQSLQLRGVVHGRLLEPPLATLVPRDVSRLTLGAGPDGTFSAKVVLAQGHSLRFREARDLRKGASAVLGGRTAGVVHVLSPRLLEITGLSRSAAGELKRLLT